MMQYRNGGRHTQDGMQIEIVGQVIGGAFGRITIRQKAGLDLEIGDILVLEQQNNSRLILSVFDLQYASQVDDKMHEMISGVALEESGAGAPDARPDAADAQVSFYEPDIVNYVIASVKPLVRVARADNRGGNNNNNSTASVTTPKALPPFHSVLRPVTSRDLEFLEENRNGLFVGSIRSGSQVIEDAMVRLPLKDVFTHHVLIPATTGRGKSNLVKTMLWHVMDSDSAADVGILVLDAHDEYYGKTDRGLHSHEHAARRLAYYTTEKNNLAGAYTLAINITSIEPRHFEGIVDFTDAQQRAIHAYHTKYHEKWIEKILDVDTVYGSFDGDDNIIPDNDARKNNHNKKDDNIQKGTLSVIRRKFKMLLGIEVHDGKLHSRHGIFDTTTKGRSTIKDIVSFIESGKIVIVDASQLESEAELIVGNMIATKLLENYKYYKTMRSLESKPVAAIVIEEAPRVIGEDVLASKNDNIYATIAREGRKFKVGLVAITQLSSIIPKTILANMTTKIILGNEMKQEREAIISSASQDLSNDDKTIASLDKGEAIISSIFVPFAIPIKVPDFDDVVSNHVSARGAAGGSGKMRVFGQ